MGILQTIRHAHRTARLDIVAHWSPDWVRRFQQRRLTKLVRYAARRSPYFAEKFRDVNLHRPELASIPTSHKAELMEHFDQTRTDPRIEKGDVENFLKVRRTWDVMVSHRYAVSHFRQ